VTNLCDIRHAATTDFVLHKHQTSHITMTDAVVHQPSAAAVPSSRSAKDRKRKGRDDRDARKKKQRAAVAAKKRTGADDDDAHKQQAAEKTNLTVNAAASDSLEWSKSKKKRMRAMKAKQSDHNSTKSMDARHHDESNRASTATTTKGEPKASTERTKDELKTGATLSSPDKIAAKDRSSSADHSASSNPPSSLSASAGTGQAKSSLAQSYQARLQGSRFRSLNEQLYTTHSQEAFEQFSSQPQLFQEYHAGFASQVENWPVQPVSVVATELKRLVLKNGGDNDTNVTTKEIKSLPHRNQPQHLVVADFGCGSAQLAQELLQVKDNESGKCPFTVHSFDLVACSDLVTACDMSKTPLETGVVDVAVFCLSLMGTNLADFIREAHRVLKASGRVMIVEVRSRFETNDDNKSNEKDRKSQGKKAGKKASKETTTTKPISELKRFLSTLERLGFDCMHLDRSNKMFLVMDLRKNGKTPDESLEFTAKPCIYKRR
jgi:ribosomal RNA-processing protein 8